MPFLTPLDSAVTVAVVDFRLVLLQVIDEIFRSSLFIRASGLLKIFLVNIRQIVIHGHSNFRSIRKQAAIGSDKLYPSIPVFHHYP